MKNFNQVAIEQWLFKLRGDYYALSAILAVKHNRKPSVGADQVPRAWVVRITTEAAGDPKFSTLWASDEEIAPLLAVLEKGTV